MVFGLDYESNEFFFLKKTLPFILEKCQLSPTALLFLEDDALSGALAVGHLMFALLHPTQFH